MPDHPFEHIDYEALGLSARDERVDYCARCGEHFDEHPPTTPAERAAWFAAERAQMGLPADDIDREFAEDFEVERRAVRIRSLVREVRAMGDRDASAAEWMPLALELGRHLRWLEDQLAAAAAKVLVAEIEDELDGN